jgi:hypothetical protein
MKKYFLLPILSLFSFVAFAQQTIHDANAELRSVGSFTAISVSGGVDLFLSYGDEAVAVSAKDAEVRSHIRTVVEDGVLKIGMDGKSFSFSGNKQIKAYVSYKNLDKITASGGCDVKASGSIKGSSLVIEISGGSDFKGAVELGSLKVNQSGGADVDISGSSDVVKVSASGGSDFNGYDLVSNICDASASGGSDIHITVNKELKANASGASDVIMKGAGTIVEKKASGASDVRKA